MNKNYLVIIILIIIIILLSAGILLSFNHAKWDSKISIKSNNTLYEGDSINVRLTDLNNTPLVNKTVNITITSGNGLSNITSNITNDKGIIKLEFNNSGNYSINCTFLGDENYTGNSTLKNITVKEEVIETEYSYSNSYSSSGGKSDSEVVAWKKEVLGDDYDAKADPYNSEYDKEYSDKIKSQYE